MELKESIDYLKNCLDDKWDFKNATREKDKQAIDTVLEELNNRISKEKILEFAKKLEDIQDKEDEKLENFGFDLGGRQFIPVRNIVADELRKLLNKE